MNSRREKSSLSRNQLTTGALGKQVVNVHSPTPPVAQFSLNDAVRVLDYHDDVPSGSVGRVLGTFPRPTETTYVVGFVEAKVSVLELHRNEIVLVDDFRAAA